MAELEWREHDSGSGLYHETAQHPLYPSAAFWAVILVHLRRGQRRYSWRPQVTYGEESRTLGGEMTLEQAKAACQAVADADADDNLQDALQSLVLCALSDGEGTQALAEEANVILAKCGPWKIVFG